MTDKLFDSFIKEKLEHYQSPVPDGLWEKIMPPEEEKPKAFWWFNTTALLIGLIVVIGIGTTIHFSTNKNSNNTRSLASKSDNNNNVTSNNNQANNSSITTTTINQQTTIVTETATNSSTEPKNYSNTTTRKPEKINAEKVENNNTITQNTKSLNNTNHADITHIHFAQKRSNYKLLANVEQNSNEKLTKNLPKIIAANKQANFSKTNSSDFLQAKSLATQNILPNSLNNLNRANNKNIDAQLAIANENYLKINNPNAALKPAIFFMGTEDCPTAKGSQRKDFYIEIYGSPNLTYRKTLSTQTGNANYLAKKDSVESASGGFTVGVRLSKCISNNILLKAGLQYSQVNEDFSLRTENERKQTIVITTHTVTRAGLPDTTISDTTYQLQIGYRLQTHTNYYKNIEIPIIVSYEIAENDSKWKFGLSAGAIINILSYYDGKSIDTGNNLVSISNKGSTPFYNSSVGLSLLGSVHAAYTLSEKMEVFAEPYYRLALSNMQSNMGFNQRFNALGFNLGVRLKLNINKHL